MKVWGLFIIIWMVSFIFISCATREVSRRMDEENLFASTETIGPKKRVAVADFRVEPVYGKRRLGNATADILVTLLQQSGRFIVVERERLANVVAEQELSLTGLVDTSTAVSIGNILGADAIIVGSVTKFGVNISSSDAIIGDSKTQIATAEVNVRLIDTGSGKIIMAKTGQGEASKKYSSFLGIGSTGGYDEALEGDALKAAVIDVVDNIVQSMNQIPWSCRVAKLSYNAVIIDAGLQSNLQLGILLDVINRGEAIKSYSTGEVLGYMEKIVGTLQVTSYFGENGAYCKIISNSGIKEGDICRFKE